MSTKILPILSRELSLANRSKIQWLLNIIQPLAYFLLFVPSISQIVTPIKFAGREVPYILFVLPGLISLAAYTYGVRAAINVYIEKASGEIEQMLTLPIPIAHYTVAKLVSALPYMTFYTVFALLVPFFIGSPLNVLQIATVTVIALFAFVVFSIIHLAIALSIKNDQMLGSVINLVGLPLTFASTAFYPISAVPGWLKPIAVINPVSLATDTIRVTLFTPEYFSGQTAIYLAGLLGYATVGFLLTRIYLRKILE